MEMTQRAFPKVVGDGLAWIVQYHKKNFLQEGFTSYLRPCKWECLSENVYPFLLP